MTSTSAESGTGVLAGEERLLIDGTLTGATGGATFEVINPATEEVAGVAADGRPADFDRAIAAARRAFDSNAGRWRDDVEFRARCVTQLRDGLVRAQERLRRILVTEIGTPIAMTHRIQLAFPIEEAGYWPGYARDFEFGRDAGTHTGMGMSFAQKLEYVPVGVVAAITPWNAPLYLNIAESVPALLAGNAVILKPAQLTPWNGLELGRIAAEETDIPPGIFQVVVSDDNDVAALLTSDPRVDMVTFTGSTAVGRKILAAAAPTVKKTVMELGGKSTHIVLDDADLAKVLPGAAAATCTMSGQGCTLATRVLLPRAKMAEGLAIMKATMEAFPYGDPWDPGNYSGPAISDVQRAKVLNLIEGAVASGATLITGGGKPAHLPRGYYIEPTLLSDVDPRSVIGQEETFGPVVTVTPYDSEEEAIAIANDTIYGLAGQVSSGDDDRALAVARQIHTGTVGANAPAPFSLTSPLGGVRQSGLGRRYGDHGFEEYLELKTIAVPA
ncbi:MAG: aldehyde dehydrogenase family protein [Streptosporangiales bacterium]|nr:aldehyde dehydrogenase family protein [Streptosporangiales bacterium]